MIYTWNDQNKFINIIRIKTIGKARTIAYKKDVAGLSKHSTGV